MTMGYIRFANHFGPFRHAAISPKGNANSSPTAQHHDADDCATATSLPEHIDAFMKVAPLEMQRALIIALHTGQRQADILKLAWSSYDGQSITLRKGKASRRGIRAAPISIRCTAALCRM